LRRPRKEVPRRERRGGGGFQNWASLKEKGFLRIRKKGGRGEIAKGSRLPGDTGGEKIEIDPQRENQGRQWCEKV